MNAKSYFLKTLSTGLLLLVLFSSVLFVLRKINMAAFFGNFPDTDRQEITICPSGLTSDWDKELLEKNMTVESSTPEINITVTRQKERLSSITASIGYGVVYNTLGIVQDGYKFEKQSMACSPESAILLKNEILWTSENELDRTCDVIYRDSQTGFLVNCLIERQSEGEKEKWVKTILGCAGSEQAGKTIDSASGRFSEDILIQERLISHEFFLYDKNLNRFFRIDFEKLKVVQGPELNLAEQDKPIQFLGRKNSSSIIDMDLQWISPILITKEGIRTVPDQESDDIIFTLFNTPILTANGQVKWLDVQNLQIVGTAGFVPENPHCQFKDMLTYDIQPVVLKDTGYQGLITGSISRFPNRIDVNVFDKEGKKIGGDTKSIQYDDLPGGPIYLTLEFLLENLHSPVLLLGSFFTSPFMDSIEAHQGMLLLPASFVGQLGFEQDKYIARIFIAIIFSLPAILLSVFLAWRVHRDAVTIGLDPSIRRRWFWCTLAMGLVAYLTYRMTRPAESLVTCENCGKLRRPDRTHCHRCGAAWNVPELTAPAWRIYTPKAG